MTRTRLVPIAGLLGSLGLLSACGGDGAAPPAAAAAQAAAPLPPDPRLPAAAVDARADAARAGARGGDTLDALRQEVALLRADVHDLREQMARLQGGTRPAAPAAADPRTDPLARQEAQQAERLRVASSESAFQGERRDARWARDATAAIQSSFAQADDALRAQVRSIDCRSQTCRVEIGSAAAAALGQQLPGILSALGASLPHVTAGEVDQGDGSRATVLFLAR
jgi:hypothetical protein